MRRCQQKPQQPIYRPGSGPLRKSGQLEDLEPEPSPQFKPKQNIQDRLKRNEDHNPSGSNPNADNDYKRQRKPEQQIYVPKPMQHERENYQKPRNKHDNWNNRNDRPKSSRAYSRNEYHNGNPPERLNKNYDYNMRQGSEPRNIRPHTVHSERMRDTRSVEPSGNIGSRNDKIQSKPPSGRRNSIGIDEKIHKNIDNLPPRFRKQYLQQQQQHQQHQQHQHQQHQQQQQQHQQQHQHHQQNQQQNSNRNDQNNTITPLLEENWDGTSLTFKNCGNTPYFHNLNRQPGPVPSYYQNYAPIRPNMHQNWSNTVPNTRFRGRGRLRQEIYDNYNVNSRSPTFSNSSRPGTPVQNSSENVSQPNSRCPTPVDHQRNVPSNFRANTPPVEVKNESENFVEYCHKVLHDDPDEILVCVLLSLI